MSATPETNPDKTLTLFDKIGGAAAVDAAVDIFYRKVLTDYRINRFFDDIDMERTGSQNKKLFLLWHLADRIAIPEQICAKLMLA